MDKLKQEFLNGFNALQKDAADTAVEKGWSRGNDGEALCLMHAEISEALEWIRNGDNHSDHIPEFRGQEEELADVIIRIAHYAGLRNLRIAEAVLAKLEYNKTRPYKHGGKKF